MPSDRITSYNVCYTKLLRVTLDGTDMKTYTDFDGNFSFDNVSVGDHKISAKLISYDEIKEKEIKVDVVKDENLKIAMSQLN